LKIRICRMPPGVWQVEMQDRGRDWHGDSFVSRHLALQALAMRVQDCPLRLLAHVKNGVWMDPLAIPEDQGSLAARSANPPQRSGSARRTRRRPRRLPLVRDESVVL
jgi:hypothetical protein